MQHTFPKGDGKEIMKTDDMLIFTDGNKFVVDLQNEQVKVLNNPKNLIKFMTTGCVAKIYYQFSGAIDF